MTTRIIPIVLSVLTISVLLTAGIWIGSHLTGSSAPVATDRDDETAAVPDSDNDGNTTESDPDPTDAAPSDTTNDVDDGDEVDEPHGAEPLEAGTIRTHQAIATGGSHTCARHLDGGVSCWGRDGHGQSGGTSVSNEPAPTTRIDGPTDVVDIAVGSTTSCALTGDGTLWCWGRLDPPNGGGDGRPLNIGTPAREVLGASDQPDVTAMDVGNHHACAVLADGTLHCIGHDHAQQLGHFEDTTPGISEFEQVEGIADTVDVAVGFDHTCALHDNGQVTCWGDNEHRQLGDDTLTSSRDPVTVDGVENAVTLIGAPWRTCAIDHTGTVTCWGANLPGGPDGQDTTPPVELSMFDPAVTMSHHSWEVCTIDTDDQLRCVGESGLLLEDDDQYQMPVEMTPFGMPDDEPATDVSVSGHTCAAMADGEVRCWGLGGDGLLGDAYQPSHGPLWLPPNPVVDLDPVG